MINNMEIPIFAILVKKKKTRPSLLSVYFAVDNVPVLVEVFLESLSSLIPISSFLFAFQIKLQSLLTLFNVEF